MVPKRRRLTLNQIIYIKEKVELGWSSDVIVGRNEKPLGCTARTLYLRFKDS